MRVYHWKTHGRCDAVQVVPAQVITGKPLFPWRNVVHQLELITDLLGSPTTQQLEKVRGQRRVQHGVQTAFPTALAPAPAPSALET